MKLFVQAPNAFSFHSIIRSEVFTITVPESSIFDQVSLSVSHFRKQTNKQTSKLTPDRQWLREDWCEQGQGNMARFSVIILFCVFLLHTYGKLSLQKTDTDSKFLPVVINTWGPPFTNATSEG